VSGTRGKRAGERKARVEEQGRYHWTKSESSRGARKVTDLDEKKQKKNRDGGAWRESRGTEGDRSRSGCVPYLSTTRGHERAKDGKKSPKKGGLSGGMNKKIRLGQNNRGKKESKPRKKEARNSAHERMQEQQNKKG